MSQSDPTHERWQTPRLGTQSRPTSPVFALNGVQFGQTGLCLHSHPVWYPGLGCSPIVIFINWRFPAYVHWSYHNALILRHVMLSSIQVQWPLSYFRSSWWFYIDSLLCSQWPGLSPHSYIVSPDNCGWRRQLSLYRFQPLLSSHGLAWSGWVTCASCASVACFCFFQP